jgi:hypothetical protein
MEEDDDDRMRFATERLRHLNFKTRGYTMKLVKRIFDCWAVHVKETRLDRFVEQQLSLTTSLTNCIIEQQRTVNKAVAKCFFFDVWRVDTREAKTFWTNECRRVQQDCLYQFGGENHDCFEWYYQSWRRRTQDIHWVRKFWNTNSDHSWQRPTHYSSPMWGFHDQ